MIKQLKNIFYFAAVSLFIVACEDVSVDEFESGSADFSTYVALGNSITSGYGDGTLFKSGQENSFPALLAQQMMYAGGNSTFNQPLTNDDTGGLLLGGNALPGFNTRLVTQLGASGVGLTNMAGPSTNEITANISGQGPFQNLGVPGAKSFHLLSPTYGSLAGLSEMPATANPFYIRFSKPNESLLAAAMSQNPTFFTLWIGNNDALTYASAGADVDALTPIPMFQFAYQTLIDNLTANGAKGVVANIPNILDLPYFTVVPANPIPMDAATAGAVNAQYAAYNGAIAAYAAAGIITSAEASLRTIQFSAGQNYPVFTDGDLTPLVNPQTGAPIPLIRQVKDGELHTLPASKVVGTLADPNNPASVIGVGVPLADTYVLTANELTEVTNAINSYNQIISTVAGNAGIPVADMNSYFSSVNNTGFNWNSVSYSTDFVTGGLFSLDGIHPSQKGYAVVANQFIDVINRSYNASLPHVDVNEYPGIALP